MPTRYLRIEEVTYGEPVELTVLVPLLQLELVDYRRDVGDVYLVSERDCEAVRAMLRLALDLGINPAGVETIMHMRQRVATLQRELRRLRRRTAMGPGGEVREAEEI